MILPPRGHLAISEDIFGCHNRRGGATGILWGEARDAAKNPTMHSTAPTTGNYLALDSAEVEKPWSTEYPVP